MTTSFARTTAWLIGLTTTVALAAARGPLHELAKSIYPTAPHAPADPPGVLELLIHNAAIAAIPGLLALIRWHTQPGWRRAGNVLIAALLAAQAVAIGLAIGAWPHVVQYLPHLPFELAALAAGAQVWHHADDPSQITRWALTVLALLAAAATLEVLAAPA